MPKLWKALVTLVALVALFIHTSEVFLPRVIWSILFFGIVTYGISLMFSTNIALHRRLGISYLVFTGLTYLVAGIFGLLPNWGLIEAAAWDSLVSPYPLLTLLETGIPHSPHSERWSQIYVYPGGEANPLFSGVVVVVSLVSIVAAAAMARETRIAYRVWLGLRLSAPPSYAPLVMW